MDISGLNTSNVTTMGKLFGGVPENVTIIFGSNFNFNTNDTELVNTSWMKSGGTSAKSTSELIALSATARAGSWSGDFKRCSLSISAVRCLSDGTESGDGQYIKIISNGQYFAVTTVHTLSIYIKRSTDTTYTLEKTVELTNSTFVDTEIIGGAYSIDNTYNVKIVLSDNYSSSTMIADISGSFHIIDARYDQKGLAFGKAAETDNEVEIVSSWKLHPHGDMEVDGDLKVEGESYILSQATIDLFNALTGNSSGGG